MVVSSHATASLVEVALTRLSSAHIDDHAPVLPAHARARWSTPSIAAPRFGDLAWDLTGLRATPLERSVIDFADLPRVRFSLSDLHDGCRCLPVA